MSGNSDAAWQEFDRLVSTAALISPWSDSDNVRRFQPDVDLLGRLLAVPIRLGLSPRSGLPAKALDVWIAT